MAALCQGAATRLAGVSLDVLARRQIVSAPVFVFEPHDERSTLRASGVPPSVVVSGQGVGCPGLADVALPGGAR